jgi:hypothetical protein
VGIVVPFPEYVVDRLAVEGGEYFADGLGAVWAPVAVVEDGLGEAYPGVEHEDVGGGDREGWQAVAGHSKSPSTGTSITSGMGWIQWVG